MNGNRFIKVSGSLIDWEWYQDGNTVRLWLHCLIKANWKEGKFKGKTIERGSFVTSVNKLSIQLGLSEQNIKTALRHLKDSGNITSKGFSKYSIITVVGYDEQQRSNKQSNLQTNQQDKEQVTFNQPTTKQQLTTIVEVLELLEVIEEVDINTFIEVVGNEFKRELTQSEIILVRQLLENHDRKLFIYALREAVVYEIYEFPYIIKILKEWKKRNFTAEMYEEGKR